MAKVLSDDLVNMNASRIITLLEDTAEDSNKLLNRLSMFVNSSKSICKGGGYDAVRTKLLLYYDALNKQAKICNILANNLLSANNFMLSYMDGYSELDNSKLPEINKSINEANSTILWLREIVYEHKYDEDGKIISTTSHTRGEQYLIDSWLDVLDELKKIREKLENLEQADGSAYAIISDVELDTVNFINATNGISNNSFSKSNCPSSKNISDVAELQAKQINITENSQDVLLATPLSSSIDSKTLNNGNNAINYLQTDPQWQDTEWSLYQKDSLANDGCGPTSTASALATVLNDPTITPKSIADKYKTYGTSTNLPIDAARDAQLDVSDNIFQGEKEVFDAVLETGGSIVYKGLGGNGKLFPTSHYIAILDHDPATDRYTICDPNSVANTNETFSFQDITSGVTEVWSAFIAPPGKTIKGILEETGVNPSNGINHLYD